MSCMLAPANPHIVNVANIPDFTEQLYAAVNKQKGNRDRFFFSIAVVYESGSGRTYVRRKIQFDLFDYPQPAADMTAHNDPLADVDVVDMDESTSAGALAKRSLVYTKKDKKYKHTALYTCGSLVQQDIEASLLLHVGRDKPTRTAQVLQHAYFRTMRKVAPGSKPEYEHGVVESIREYARGMNTHGVKDKQQLHHLRLLAASTINTTTMSTNAARFRKFFGFGKARANQAFEQRDAFDRIVARGDEALREAKARDTGIDVGNHVDGLASAGNANAARDVDDDGSSSEESDPSDDGSEAKSDTSSVVVSESGDEDGVIVADCPTVIVAKNAKRWNPFEEIWAYLGRKRNKNYLLYAPVREFCHGTSACATVDTSRFGGRKLIEDPDDNSFSYHHLRTKLMPTDEAYQLFLKSDIWAAYQKDHEYWGILGGLRALKKPTMSLRAFQIRFCPCLIDVGASVCANSKVVDMNNALKAVQTMMSYACVQKAVADCRCGDCGTDKWREAYTSVRAMQDLVMCDQRDYHEFSYLPLTSDTRASIEAKNVAAATTKAKTASARQAAQGNSMAAKKSKPERQSSAIQGSQFLGQFRLHTYKCPRGECDQPECGLSKYFGPGRGCMAAFNAAAHCKIKTVCYRNQVRGNGVELELTELQLNGLQLREHVYRLFKVGLPHLWDMHWNSNYEKYTFSLLAGDTTRRTVHVHGDFGALVTVLSQDAMTNPVPLRAIQDIMITTTLEKVIKLPSGQERTLYHSIEFHIWAQSGQSLLPNHFFTYHVLRRLLRFHRDRGEGIEVVKLFTDQCASQFKSRKTAWMLRKLADEFDLEAILHQFSATGDGKGQVDGASGDGAETCRKIQLRELTHANEMFPLFVYMAEQAKKKPPVLPDDAAARKSREIKERIHWFIVDERNATQSMRDRAASDHDDVIITNTAIEDFDATKIEGIMSCYQLLMIKKAALSKGTLDAHRLSAPQPRSVSSASSASAKSTSAAFPYQLFSRRGPCPCTNCNAYHFSDCEYTSEVGLLVAHNQTEVAVPPPPAISIACVEAASFFGELLVPGEYVFVAISGSADIDGPPYRLALLTSTPKIVKALTTVETNDGQNSVVFKKGDVTANVKLLAPHEGTERSYVCAPRTPNMLVSLSSFLIPTFHDGRACTRNDYLNIVTTSLDVTIKRTTKTLDIFQMSEEIEDALLNRCAVVAALHDDEPIDPELKSCAL
jgi:hypothetical protein